MMSQLEIRAPAEQTEGTRSQILRWLKSIGDAVSENEPLIEIETDKVTVEVASPGSGTLREILKQAQEEIAPGDLLGRIETREAASNAQMRPVAASAADAAAGPAVTGAIAVDGIPGSRTSREAGGTASRTLSPAVRRLLAERGLDASEVRGTGQGGRVTVTDVLAHNVAAAQPAADTAPASRTGSLTGESSAPGATAMVGGISVPSRRIPHSATRRRIAEHMVQSLLHTAPHVTTVFEADLSAVLDHRQRNKDEFSRQNIPLTLTAYFLQAAVAAIRAVPEANSRWTDSELEVFDSMHIGVATALDSGLVVPVLRDVQSLDLFETARGLEAIVSRARDGRLSPSDVRGGTFTISNHGVSGSLVATPIIINQPQSAILGVGKLEKRPVVVSEGGPERLEIRPQCYVTLTIDHRVMDGHQANRFLQTFVQRLASSHW